MNNNSRTINSFRNVIVGFGGQLAGVTCGFACRTVFINTLGTEYLGVQGLFANILSILSLAELGIGSAIVYSMYKPLAEKNEKEISALMGLYARAYKIIGGVVACIGLMLVPFLDRVIKDPPDIPYLSLIYLMFLANTVISYFFAYKSAIIVANQQKYITAIYEFGFNILQSILQIVVLVYFKKFIVFLAVQIVCSFLSNYCISRKADKLFPFLRNTKREYLDKEAKTVIYKNVKAMLMHKIGGVAAFYTDNILISMYVGIHWVGLYSNYSMLTSIVERFLTLVLSSISASVGHLHAEENEEKSYEIFSSAFFINFWLYGFCTVCFWVLVNPFISAWIGSQYIMSTQIVIIIIVNFFFMGMRKVVSIYKDAMGLFWNDRFKAIVEAIINLGASLLLVQKLGIAGVLYGTFISFLATSFWVEPFVLYKHGFRKPLWNYFVKYIIYSCVTVTTALVTEFICRTVFSSDRVFDFICKFVLCMMIPNGIFTILFYRTKEFKRVCSIGKGVGGIFYNKIQWRPIKR